MVLEISLVPVIKPEAIQFYLVSLTFLLTFKVTRLKLVIITCYIYNLRIKKNKEFLTIVIYGGLRHTKYQIFRMQVSMCKLNL